MIDLIHGKPDVSDVLVWCEKPDKFKHKPSTERCSEISYLFRTL